MAKYSNLATVQIFKDNKVEKIGKVEEVVSAVKIKEQIKEADLSALANLSKVEEKDEGMSL